MNVLFVRFSKCGLLLCTGGMRLPFSCTLVRALALALTFGFLLYTSCNSKEKVCDDVSQYETALLDIPFCHYNNQILVDDCLTYHC